MFIKRLALSMLVSVTVCDLYSDSYCEFNSKCILFFEESCDSLSSNTLLVEGVKRALSEMGPSKPFVGFDMRLTGEDIDCLNKLRIATSYSEYDNYGDLSNFRSELTTFLQSLGNEIESSEAATKIITNLVNQVIIASGKETAWVTLRASTATIDCDVPRWHKDGYFYDHDLELNQDEQYKVVMVFKGPQTLFYNLPDEMREEFNILCEVGNEREALAKMLDITKAISAKPYHGAAFIVGDVGYEAVHSEPPIHEDRLFLSILPGSKKQIRELYDRWHSVKE